MSILQLCWIAVTAVTIIFLIVAALSALPKMKTAFTAVIAAVFLAAGITAFGSIAPLLPGAVAGLLPAAHAATTVRLPPAPAPGVPAGSYLTPARSPGHAVPAADAVRLGCRDPATPGHQPGPAAGDGTCSWHRARREHSRAGPEQPRTRAQHAHACPGAQHDYTRAWCRPPPAPRPRPARPLAPATTSTSATAGGQCMARPGGHRLVGAGEGRRDAGHGAGAGLDRVVPGADTAAGLLAGRARFLAGHTRPGSRTAWSWARSAPPRSAPGTRG